MESPIAYIPMDRRQAMVQGQDLPDRMQGALLFADISGFTPLTEALLREYGPRRGPEELTQQLNLIYDALVSDVHHSGGSVMGFSGDAITCWFDEDDGLRAISCGLAMQQTMGRFEALETPSGKKMTLAMKAAVATGPVRRFRLGDPQIQFMDTLAGATLDAMAEAEHQAEKGEVVIGPDVIVRVGDKVDVVEWRTDPQTGERFGVVAQLKAEYRNEVKPQPWPALSPDALSEEQTRPWLLAPVHERLRADRGTFLAELRPGVTFFLSFSGIDYDRDEAAGAKLDAYVRWVQQILHRYEAFLLQLTIGDKGSYLYSAFGAPIAHEDDAVRAMSAALELRTPPPDLDFIDNIQIGISQGQMRTGAYGGTSRRTYGVLGDEVNLAARLMQAAEPGQILVSQAARQVTADAFTWESLPAIKVKGKSEPVSVYSLLRTKQHYAIELSEPAYALPMVGREAELALIEQKLDRALAGQGQIIGIVAEAGMGKSRLLAEVIHLAGERELVGYAGESQSYGTNISYLVWQSIWRGFFGMDPAWETPDQVSELERQLALIDPALLPRLPLLEAVFNLSIPDNDLTRSFDAKLRKSSLEGLLADCLRTRARRTPLLLVLEDSHWLDPLSHDLLEVIGRAIADLPVLLVMAYRPPEMDRLQTPRVDALPYFTEVRLTDFTPQEAERLIGLKLKQFAGAEVEMPRTLLKRITTRAGGNPFYIEELLNYLHDQGLDPQDIETLEQLELPSSLHSLILSRIDQLNESQKSTIKVASVIGRLFRAAWLWGVYPDLGEPDHIKNDLQSLSGLDLTPLDKPDPELTYLFKHIVTQEVAYESLPYATRSTLHEQLAWYLERAYSDKLDQYIDLLAFHYGRSQNKAKQREYLLKAGEAAQADYANETAIDYYQRVLPLLPAEEQVAVTLKLGDVQQLLGHWSEADRLYQETLTLAEQLGDRSTQARCQNAMGELLSKQGQYDQASDWLEHARATFDELSDQAGVGQVLHIGGTLAAQQGDLDLAQTRYEESLAIRRALDDTPKIAALLSNLGIVARLQGDYETARTLHEEALMLRYGLGDKWAIAISLNNLGNVALDQGDLLEARTQLEVALDLQREIGDRQMIANALHSLGNVTRTQADYPMTRSLYSESLTMLRELGEKWLLAHLLEDMGGLAALEDQPRRALRLVGAAAALRDSIGAPISPAYLEKLEAMVGPARQALGDTAAAAAEAEGQAMPLEEAIGEALKGG